MRKIHKSVPQTESERYLSDLCSRSFLSLWSYPGIYRDQAGTGGEGKEVCDLLVVFGRHVIIFSDKYCRFNEEGPVELAWSRWFKKTIESSAAQVFGAERWIRSFPSRLFLDRKCTQHFPMAMPEMSQAVFHRIVVAHGISEPFRRMHGGSGSLMLLSDIVGSQHYNTPFMVGWVGEQSKGYVHVFDDTTLDIVMGTLDTITDFIWYLEQKERLFASSTKVSAAGEEELLAYYLGHLGAEGHHEFSFPSAYDAIAITEGHWADFLGSKERAAQTEADKISYAWDALIEKFSHHVMEGTQYEAVPAGVDDQEKIFRFMAREPRTRRRMLARALLEKIATTPGSRWGMRLMLPSTKGDPHYVFLAFPRFAGQSEHEYRTARRELLLNYCIVTRLEHSAAEEIVGIATEEGVDTYPRTEDAIYYDARGWTAADEVGARKIQKELGLLRRVAMRKTTEYEYPSAPARWSGSVSRNSPCPCGSRKRYKRCHGALRAG